MTVAGLLVFINDIHGLGPHTAGLYPTDSGYSDQDDASAASARCYFARMKKQPPMLQAADESAAADYRNAVNALGSDDGDKVMAQLKRPASTTSSLAMASSGRMVAGSTACI
jgi:branched-chain amino acid transport system substrate-binding protein